VPLAFFTPLVSQEILKTLWAPVSTGLEDRPD